MGAQIDASVLPRALREQMSEMLGAADAPAPAPAAEADPVGIPAVEPQANPVTEQPYPGRLPLEQKVEGMAAQEGYPAAPNETVEQQLARTQQAYSAMSGRYRKENGELRARVAELQAEHDRLTARVADLEKGAAAVPNLAERYGLTAEQVADFGEEWLQTISRIAQAEAARASGESTPPPSRAGEATEQTFYEQLTLLLPDWTETNRDAEFIAWLRLIEPGKAFSRQAELDKAVEAGDAEAASEMFRRYRRERGVPGITPEVLAQVLPGGRANPGPVPQGPRPKWTQAQVAQEMEYLNKHPNAPDAYARMQALDAAMAEGRISP